MDGNVKFLRVTLDYCELVGREAKVLGVALDSCEVSQVGSGKGACKVMVVIGRGRVGDRGEDLNCLAILLHLFSSK